MRSECGRYWKASFVILHALPLVARPASAPVKAAFSPMPLTLSFRLQVIMISSNGHIRPSVVFTCKGAREGGVQLNASDAVVEVADVIEVVCAVLPLQSAKRRLRCVWILLSQTCVSQVLASRDVHDTASAPLLHTDCKQAVGNKHLSCVYNVDEHP